jgi:murein DD-endopeptidase MepM/ murein hydrolase activator NlpD
MDGSKIILMLRYKYLAIFCLLLAACPAKKEEVVKPVYSKNAHIVARGENLDVILGDMVPQSVVVPIIDALKQSEFPFRQCIPGDSVHVMMKDGQFSSLSYYKNIHSVYYLKNECGHLVISMKFPYYDTIKCLISGKVNSTLYESLVNLGETPNFVWRFVDIYAWEIDFVTDTRNGDQFTALVNKIYCDSQFVTYDLLVATKYIGEIGDYYSIYYCDPDSHEDYYNLKGESLRKSLLKSPLRYSYISSYFSKRRFHPILKVWRPHHGLDYSAPTGTPVSSIGDGIVTYKGWRGGYGNLVEIKHKNNFKTRYGHLSKYAKGLYKGQRVKAGDLIGYVGSTGLSTGPHLHFELHKNGVPINPLTVKIPRAPSVKEEYMKQFEQVRDSLLQYIEQPQETDEETASDTVPVES